MIDNKSQSYRQEAARQIQRQRQRKSIPQAGMAWQAQPADHISGH